jgi:eukaryotic-like serine/threonine-protein kinase
VSRLTHVNTVQTFDFGSFDGALYLVMEYVRGEDLGAIVKRDGPLPYARVGPIFSQICAALAEAHEAGIIHRDLKPENVLVTRGRDGRDVVKVVDFGLAKVREREEANEVTGRGNLVGTPYYMSPEQIRSDGVDARSDVYSLGAMLYRVLTGEPPFAGATPMAVLTKHLTDELVPPRQRVPDRADDIDDRVEAIVMRAMAKKPEDRYQNVEELREDLEAALLEEEPPALARGSTPMRRLSDRGGESGESGEKRVRSPQAFEQTAPHQKHTAEELGVAGEGEQDSAQGLRLRRADLDDYEKSLRRRGWVRTMVVPLIVLVLAGSAAVTLRWWQRRPRTVEAEPNNDAEHATRIAMGRATRGKLKGRIDDSTGDLDFFRLPAGKPGPRVLRAQLDGIPNIDLELDVMDDSGRALARADATAVGGREVLPDVRFDGHGLYLVVREVPVTGKWPMENSEDSYRLLLNDHALGEDEASEPCDDSNPGVLHAGRTLTGYLGQPGDRDVFILEAAPGQVAIEVSGVDGVDVALQAGGVTADRGGVGAPERLEVAWPASGQVAVWRKDAAGRPPEREAAGARALGMDVPYRITVTAR